MAQGVALTKYSSGPRLEFVDEGESEVTVWARYVSGPALDALKLDLGGTPAVVAGSFGRRRVGAFGPHCERTPTDQSLILKAALWAATPMPAARNSLMRPRSPGNDHRLP